MNDNISFDWQDDIQEIENKSSLFGVTHEFSFKLQNYILNHPEISKVYYIRPNGEKIVIPIDKDFRIRINMNCNRGVTIE